MDTSSLKIRLFLVLAGLFAPLAGADDYYSLWSFSLACPTFENAGSSGDLTASAGGFSTGGACHRLGNGYAKYAFSGASGGTLRSNDLYAVQTGKLSFIPPILTTDTTPVFSVAGSCSTLTRDVNWIFVQSAASRTTEYFWGRSTMTPSSTTMTVHYQIDGGQNWVGNYSLPVGSCASGMITVSGSVDFEAKIFATSEWTGFYKTGPGNASFFVPVWEVNQSFLGSKTYAGGAFSVQDADSFKMVQVTSNAGGSAFTVKPFSDPETSTLDASEDAFTDTITITHVNSPQPGMMRGTISRVDSNSDPVGTTENVGCLAYDSGAGGIIIGCASKNPVNSAQNYVIHFNYKIPAGDLDPLFGTGGVASSSLREGAASVALQADGKIVVAGFYGGSYRLLVARYNSDGTLDSSFGSAGTVKLVTTLDARDVAIQSDGKIVVTANHNNGSNYDFAVLRFHADGSADTAFGSEGKVTTAIGSGYDYVEALAIQGDEKTVVAGYYSNGSNTDFALARYSTDGSLDTSFGSGGKVTTAIGSSNDEIKSLAIQGDGKIIAVGTAYVGSNWDFAMARYNTDGSLDTSFGSGGRVTTAVVSATDIARTVAIQSDGKIVLAGESYASGYEFALVRYQADGSLDTGFGSEGIVRSKIGMETYQLGRKLAIQDDGKIVLVGTYGESMAIVRYLADGSLDTSFGSGGLTTATNGGEAVEANDLVIQHDGKIIAAGYSWDSGIDERVVISRIIP